MHKAQRADDARTLRDIPNIGVAMAADLELLGVRNPDALRDADPYALYGTLCKLTGQRQDPCVLDTLTSATRFMAGAPARPWWYYTPERKQRLLRSLDVPVPDAATKNT